MRDRLTGKHIDLDALAEFLKGFFNSSMFRVTADKRSAEFKIVAFPRIGSDLCDSIEVLIQGNPDDFTVQFGESESQSRKLASLGRLTSILGGGVFLKKGLESQAELEKLENSFWAFFDAKIDSLEKR